MATTQTEPPFGLAILLLGVLAGGILLGVLLAYVFLRWFRGPGLRETGSIWMRGISVALLAVGGVMFALLLALMLVPTLGPMFSRLLRDLSPPGPVDGPMKYRIVSLACGAQMWKLDETNNRYYPGQKDPNVFDGAASAYLARCLLSDPNGELSIACDRWAVYRNGAFDEDGSETGVPYTPMDMHYDSMPILYFVSRKESKGAVEQFVEADCRRYLTPENVSPAGLHGFLRSQAPDIPMDGRFLLISAGPDRIYFTADDVTNW